MPDRLKLSDKSLTDLAHLMAAGQPGSQRDHEAHAEFLRRQTACQQEAAEAAKATAVATARYTKYMLWSVIVLALSAFVSMAFEALRYYRGR